MRSYLYLALLLFTFFELKAQDSTYVLDYTNKINVKVGLDTNTFSFKTTNISDNTSYELKPNESVRLTTSFHYRFLGLTVGFSPKFLNDNQEEELKGESDINSIRLRLFIKRFVQEFNYYKIRGVYIENTSDYVDDWVKGQDPYLQLNGLRIRNFGGKTSFVWNKNFSYKALLVQNEKQLKSAGSFVPSLSYSYSELSNPEANFVNNDERNLDITLNAGYIHNFVFGKDHNFYSSLGIFPGLGIKFAKTIEKSTTNSIEEIKETHPNFNFEGRLNLGYNSDRIFTGLQFNVFGVTYNKNPETRVQDSNVYFQLFFGYRFGAPKPIAQFFDKIHKKKK